MTRIRRTQTRHTRFTKTAISALAIGLTATLTACGGNSNNSGPTPLISSSAPTSPAPSTSAPAWASKYTADQIDLYQQALAAYTKATKIGTQLWNRGKSDQESQALLEHYWWGGTVPEEWLYDVAVKNRVKPNPHQKVYWSKPIVIAKTSAYAKTNPDYHSTVIGGTTAVVHISQCVSWYPVGTTDRSGGSDTYLPASTHVKAPIIIDMVLANGGQSGDPQAWKINEIVLPTKDEPCKG